LPYIDRISGQGLQPGLKRSKIPGRVLTCRKCRHSCFFPLFSFFLLLLSLSSPSLFFINYYYYHLGGCSDYKLSQTASLSTGNGRETVKSIGTKHSIFFKTWLHLVSSGLQISFLPICILFIFYIFFLKKGQCCFGFHHSHHRRHHHKCQVRVFLGPVLHKHSLW